MHSSISTVPSTTRTQAGAKTLQALWRLDLISGLLIMFAAISFTLGSAWDIKWHGLVGRDRTFTSSHDMILSGIAIAGLVAVISVFIETAWARRSAVIRANSTPFAGLFYGSFGAYVAGFGALSAAVAFPLDNYWHSLHGLDVSLWAPFHLMIFGGSLILTLGGVFTLLAAAYRAREQGAKRASTLAFIGAIIALGTFTSLMMGMADPAYGNHSFIDIASFSVSLYPIMFCVLALLAAIAALNTIPWRWAATSVTIAFIAILLFAEYFVPVAMTYAVQAEHFNLLPGKTLASAANVIKQPLPALLCLIALGLDLTAWYGKKKQWSAATVTRALMLVAFPLLLISTGIGFFWPMVTDAFPYLQLSGDNLPSTTALVVSLACVLPGTILGVWLGRNMGRVLQGVQAA